MEDPQVLSGDGHQLPRKQETENGEVPEVPRRGGLFFPEVVQR